MFIVNCKGLFLVLPLGVFVRGAGQRQVRDRQQRTYAESSLIRGRRVPPARGSGVVTGGAHVFDMGREDPDGDQKSHMETQTLV